jgi:hypothetical protein
LGLEVELAAGRTQYIFTTGERAGSGKATSQTYPAFHCGWEADTTNRQVDDAGRSRGHMLQRRPEYDAVFTANSLHHALAGVEHLLKLSAHAGGHFIAYGPFSYQGQFTSDSNAVEDGKSRQPSWNIRDFEAVKSAL